MRTLKSVLFSSIILITTLIYVAQNNTAKEEYAILVNGDTSELHKGNITRAFKTLSNKGYKTENIYVASINNPNMNNKINHTYGTIGGIEAIVNRLSKKVDDNDIVLVYTTGHGGKENNESTLVLSDEEYAAKNFVGLLEKLNSEYLVYVGDQCYSGSFVETITKSNIKRYMVLSSQGPNNSGLCEYYANEFWKLNQDTNKDGKVTWYEVHTAAVKAQLPIEGDLKPLFKTKNLGSFSVPIKR